MFKNFSVGAQELLWGFKEGARHCVWEFSAGSSENITWRKKQWRDHHRETGNAEQVPRGKLQGHLWLDAKEASLGGPSLSPGAVRPIRARERGWRKICSTPGRVAVPGEPDFISVLCS